MKQQTAAAKPFNPVSSKERFVEANDRVSGNKTRFRALLKGVASPSETYTIDLHKLQLWPSLIHT